MRRIPQPFTPIPSQPPSLSLCGPQRSLQLQCHTHASKSPSTKKKQRKSWDPKGVDVWYLGPAKSLYRCHRVYYSRTNSERITDIIHIFPHNASPPHVTVQEDAIIATESLTDTLINPTTLKHFGDK